MPVKRLFLDTIPDFLIGLLTLWPASVFSFVKSKTKKIQCRLCLAWCRAWLRNARESIYCTSTFISITWLLLATVIGWMCCALVELLFCNNMHGHLFWCDYTDIHRLLSSFKSLYIYDITCTLKIVLSDWKLFSDFVKANTTIICDRMIEDVEVELPPISATAFRLTSRRNTRSFQFTAMRYARCPWWLHRARRGSM